MPTLSTFLFPKNVALLAPALTFVEIYLAPLAFSLTFVEIYLALLAPPLTLANTYPAPLVPRPQCPTRQRRSTASPCRATETVYLCTRNRINMHFPPRGPRFLKSGPLMKKSHIAFFQMRPPQKKKRAAGETV